MSTEPELTSFSRERFSPLAFDVRYAITDAEIDVLLEAARRAPSAGNSQPWRFIIGRRGDTVHERLTRHLTRSSSRWAPTASLLVANLTRLYVDESDLEYSEFAHYDLGQAVAHLSFQVHALGLAVHQFRAFDRDGIAAEFNVPKAWEVTTLAAIGAPGTGTNEVTGPGTSRDRLAVDNILWPVD